MNIPNAKKVNKKNAHCKSLNHPEDLKQAVAGAQGRDCPGPKLDRHTEAMRHEARHCQHYLIYLNVHLFRTMLRSEIRLQKSSDPSQNGTWKHWIDAEVV